MCLGTLESCWESFVNSHCIFCISREAREGYADYRQRCNAFFMELVSSLCFPGDVPPETAVIQKLLEYITKESLKQGRVMTQRMNIFQETIDPTPVVRSFLLQLLLRSE